MCEQLDVSASGFYAWRRRKPSKRASEDVRLGVVVAEAHRRSKNRYGSPRVFAELKARGVRVGRKRVARLMRAQGLVARPKRNFRRTTKSDHAKPIAPNLLARNFTAPA